MATVSQSKSSSLPIPNAHDQSQSLLFKNSVQIVAQVFGFLDIEDFNNVVSTCRKGNRPPFPDVEVRKRVYALFQYRPGSFNPFLMTTKRISDVVRANRDKLIVELSCFARLNLTDCLSSLVKSRKLEPDCRGWAVSEAAENGHVESVRILLAAKAIPQEPCQATIIAAAEGRPEIWKLLHDNDPTSLQFLGDLLVKTCQDGDIVLVRKLFALKPNITQAAFDLAWRAAIQNEHLDIATELKSYGTPSPDALQVLGDCSIS